MREMLANKNRTEVVKEKLFAPLKLKSTVFVTLFACDHKKVPT